jgi:hypothetical protein
MKPWPDSNVNTHGVVTGAEAVTVTRVKPQSRTVHVTPRLQKVYEQVRAELLKYSLGLSQRRQVLKKLAGDAIEVGSLTSLVNSMDKVFRRCGMTPKEREALVIALLFNEAAVTEYRGWSFKAPQE